MSSETIGRWRLVLGASSDAALGGAAGLSGDDLARDAALS